MQAKLLQHQALIRKRNLLVAIQTITFAPAVPQIEAYADGDHAICDSNSLIPTIDKFNHFDADIYPSLVSVIQAISTLRRGRKKRELHNPDSRGTKIKSLEDFIANLDSQQSAAVVETFEGVQRIRGLAGPQNMTRSSWMRHRNSPQTSFCCATNTSRNRSDSFTHTMSCRTSGKNRFLQSKKSSERTQMARLA